MGSHETCGAWKVLSYLVLFNSYVAYLLKDYRPSYAIYSVVVLCYVRLSVVVENLV